MSDPRQPEDGPNWPERDLGENRDPEPGAGWSDDPYRFEPLPPNKPSDEPLEGEWSDSEPFDSEPAESDPFAPAPTPPQDDPWGFPPRTEPAYEPASTEPEFEPEPAWGSDARPASDAPTEEQPPDEPDHVAAESPAPYQPEPEPEPAPYQPEPTPYQSEPEPAPYQPEPTPAPPPVAGYGYTPEPDAEPESDEGEADAEPEPQAEPAPEAELEPSASAPEPEPDHEPVAEVAASAVAAEAVADAPEPMEEITGPAVVAGAAADMPEASASEADDAREPEPFPEPEPEYETERDASDDVAVAAAAATTAFGSADEYDPKLHGNRRRPTTAEQAVPWLIGIILALAGMVIVLLALIFSSPGGLVASSATPTPSASVQPSSSAVALDPSTEPSASADPSSSAPAVETSAPTPDPAFGPLEMSYLGRPTTTAPIYLLLRDFSVDEDADVLAQADSGVSSYANAPDGRVAAAVINGRAVAIDKKGKPRALADNIDALTFGWDGETVYAARITREGDDDQARILEIDFVSGATKTLNTIRYPHPVTGAEAPVKEAQFIDNGGTVRLYAVADGNLTLWVLGAPATYRIDPANGDVTEIGREPILWSPDGTHRVTVHEDGNKTSLRLRDRGNTVVAGVTVNGLVSHLRWAGGSNEIVFTLGVSGANGGVRQDLFVWDLQDRKDPMPLTSSGAAFGAEWRGVMSNWGP